MLKKRTPTKPKKKKEPKGLKESKSKLSRSITYSQPFAGMIEMDGNKKRIAIQSPVYYQHQLNKFKVGDRVTLEIHTRKSKRSEAQNRYLWGVYYPIIAEETGERDLDRLHEFFKGKFLTTGIEEVMGEKVRMKKSTTNLSVADFCMFIMDIEALTGIEAPPTQDYELEPIKRQ